MGVGFGYDVKVEMWVRGEVVTRKCGGRGPGCG